MSIEIFNTLIAKGKAAGIYDFALINAGKRFEISLLPVANGRTPR